MKKSKQPHLLARALMLLLIITVSGCRTSAAYKEFRNYREAGRIALPISLERTLLSLEKAQYITDIRFMFFLSRDTGDRLAVALSIKRNGSFESVYHSKYFALDRDCDGDWSNAEIYYLNVDVSKIPDFIYWPDEELKLVLELLPSHSVSAGVK